MTEAVDTVAEVLSSDQDSEGLDRSIPESRRPALRKLTLDVEELVSAMRTGFGSRRETLEWCRRTIPRTLGEVPTRWYREVAVQFQGNPEDGERTLLAALLTGEVRTRELDEQTVDELRTRLAVEVFEPAYHKALRQLRSDATEYVDAEESEDTAHDPHRQRYIGMRPVLDEYDDYQRITLEALLEGLEDVEHIRKWGQVLELATHGELPEGFIARCIDEKSTRTLLTETDPSPAQRSARELFAATYLLPNYNRGIRDLRSRSKEEPDSDTPEREVPLS